MNPSSSSRRTFLKAIGLGVAGLSAPLSSTLQAAPSSADTSASPAARSAAATPGEAKNRPNIILLMTDSQSARCSAREGFPLDTTPFLDQLARQGVWFDKAYSAAPQCVPSRVSILTGRFPNATGIRQNTQVGKFPPRFHKDIFDVVREQGYATAMIGKNHTHLKADRCDFWFTTNGKDKVIKNETEDQKKREEWMSKLHVGIAEEANPYPLESQEPYRLVDVAAQWIHEIKDQKPFFIYYSFQEPHAPYEVCEPYYSLFPPESLPPVQADKSAIEGKGFKWQFDRQLMNRSFNHRIDELIPRMRSNYYGMMRLLDDQFKRFIGLLEKEGVRENTFIFFISDHGDFTGDYGLIRKGVEMPEDLIRVPFFVNGPGIKAQVEPHPAHVSSVDIMPTVCEIIGTSLPHGVQGRSLWPLLTGAEYPAKEFASAYAEQGFGGLDYDWNDNPDFDRYGSKTGITYQCLNQYTQCGILRMLRKDEWKLLYDMQGRGQLYNLAKDPAEVNNLFDVPEHATVRARMVEELLTWTLRAQDPLPPPNGMDRRKSHPRNYWTDAS